MRLVVTAVATALLASCLAMAQPAAAQATRTWISGVGDDVNPCSRTAPCKTFAGALPKTAAGGEINCLDPGGFGGVTIDKALSIVCDHVVGGALASGSAITIAAGPGDVVFLSGLGMHGANPPENGVRFVSGAALHLRNSSVRGFATAISLEPANAANVTIDRVTIVNNKAGVRVAPASGGAVNATIVDSFIAHNDGAAISAVGAGAVVRVSDSTITSNDVGVSTGSGGRIVSYRDNRLHANRSDGAFTSQGGAQ